MEFENLGVFLCSCKGTLNLDFKGLAKRLEKIEGVSVVERVETLCSEEGLAYIVDDIRRKKLDKIVLAACSNKNQVFEDIAKGMGLDIIGTTEIVNIREECAWVHEDKKAATEKALNIVKGAVKRQADYPELLDIQLKPSVLIAGDTRALDLANSFRDFDAEIHILNEEPYFRRKPLAPESYDPTFKGSTFEYSDAVLHTNSKIIDISGDLGGFIVEIEKDRHIDPVRCVDCAKCVETCPKKAVYAAPDSTATAYVIDEKCNLCGECQKVCPTNAIVLEKTNTKIEVGQIISFYPLKSREGVYLIDSKMDSAGAKAAALKAALNLKGYKKKSLIKSDLKKCANHHLREKKLNIKGCQYCVDTCAYYPVSPGVVSDLACKGCGACASSCPQDVYELKESSFDEILRDVEAAGETSIKEKIVLFTCAEGGYSTLKAAGIRRLKYPPALPIFVPCLGSVSELHILRAFDIGFSGVVLLGCGGEKCVYRKGFTQGSTSAGYAKKLLGFFGIGDERVRLMQNDGTDPEKFVNQMKEFGERLKGLGKNPLSNKAPVDLLAVEKRGSKKRQMLHALTLGFAEKTGIKKGMIKADLPAAYLNVNEKECTLCGACVFHCNTGALRKGGDEVLDIYKTHTYCIACGICEDICPEKAIGLDKGIFLDEFLEKKEHKFDVKIINCTRCGRPLMAEAALSKLRKKLKEGDFEMLQICQGCHDRYHVAALTDTDPEKITVFRQGKMPWDNL